MTDTGFCLSRRDLLRTLGAAGVTTITAGILVACGDSGPTTVGTTPGAAAPDTTTGGGEAAEAPPIEGPSAPAPSAPGGGEAAAAVGIALADVPVGEARVVDVDGRRLVVAQLSEGAVVAYSSACTHQQVTVEAAGGLLLRCPKHGSEFDATDGTATLGPARAPLPAITAAVSGDRIVFS